MHAYSIDREMRSRFVVAIFIISMIISLVLNNTVLCFIQDATIVLETGKFGNVVKMLEWLEINKNIIGVPFWYGVLSVFFDKVAWKWLTCIHSIPNLNGKWEGKLNSTFEAEKQPTVIPMKMKIKQTWTKILITTEFEKTDSVSNSNVAAIYVDGNKGTQLYFGYINESFDVSKKMQTHYGYNILTIKDNDKIKARYFNDRQNPNSKILGGNKGTFELNRIKQK